MVKLEYHNSYCSFGSHQARYTAEVTIGPAVVDGVTYEFRGKTCDLCISEAGEEPSFLEKRLKQVIETREQERQNKPKSLPREDYEEKPIRKKTRELELFDDDGDAPDDP